MFTPGEIVEKMVGLRRRRGRILEPAAGNGAFVRRLPPGAVAIDVDGRLASRRVRQLDFFSLGPEERFSTIIGNPPYVRFQDIRPPTKQLLDVGRFDRRTNLFLFFIDRCLDHLRPHGELIFITPRDFIKSTNAARLNARLYRDGGFTHFEELGDSCVFGGYSPNVAIWRWQKNLGRKRLDDGRLFNFSKGQIWFGPPPCGVLGDAFEVKVGAVSGANRLFEREERTPQTRRFVCSETRRTGRTRHMIYGGFDSRLLRHKAELLRRRVREFGQGNWHAWGREYPDRPGPRIYVNSKTREGRPFFVSPVRAFDGSVLALFPKRPRMDLHSAADKLNAVDWEGIGFKCGGRLLFTQRSLENAPVVI